MSDYSPETFFDGRGLELARAINRGDVKEVSVKANGLDLNQAYRQKMTFLFFSLVCNQLKVAAELIKLGASPYVVSPGFGSPLDFAVRANEDDMLRAMLDAGVSPNATNSWGTPLLFTAACKDSTKTMELLVDRGADLNVKDTNLGRTALFEAFSKLCYDQTEYLITHGAKVDISLLNGVTFAYSLQKRLGQQKIGTAGYEKLNEIKKLVEARGVKFPADPPPVVRSQLKAQGLRVAE